MTIQQSAPYFDIRLPSDLDVLPLSPDMTFQEHYGFLFKSVSVFIYSVWSLTLLVLWITVRSFYINSQYFTGDSMLNNLLESLGGRQFITKDRNPWCPTKRKSGWWYSGCSQCNVLGLYNPGEWGEEYLIWKTWRSRTCLSKMTMMIKPLFTVP